MSLEAVLADPAVRPRGLTRAQYDALIDLGALEGQRVELIEGVLVEVVPQGEEREDAIEALNHYLVPRVVDPWRVRVQLTLLATDSSEPEPDIAIAQRPRGQKPSTAALVIEVAVTSQRTDLVHKAVVYAAAGVEQYWVLDVPRREVVVHTQPRAGGYGTVERRPGGTTRSRGRTAPLTVLGIPVDLEALLPPA